MKNNNDFKPVSNNKKAFHDYTILEKITAGIVLTGTEIKSVRKGGVNLKDGFAKIENEEMWLYNVHISPYEQGNRYNHESERKRKLLLTKQEIKKLLGKTKEQNLTIVPLSLFIKGGWAKIELGIAKGKALHDKRDSIAKKDVKREIDRAIKEKNR